MNRAGRAALEDLRLRQVEAVAHGSRLGGQLLRQMDRTVAALEVANEIDRREATAGARAVGGGAVQPP